MLSLEGLDMSPHQFSYAVTRALFRNLALAVAVVLGLVLLSGPARAATWSAPTDLSETGQSATDPEIAMSVDGTYQIAAWQRGDGSKLRVQISTSADGGATWTSPDELSAAGQSANAPDVAVSSDGRYQMVAWSRSNGTSFITQVRVSSDFGETWAAAKDLSVAGRNADYERVAMSSDGKYQTVIWRRYDGSHFVVQTATSSDFGANWSSPKPISSGATAYLPQVAMSSDGKYQTIVWQQNTSPRVIQARTSTDFGVNWSTPISLSSTADNSAENAQVAISADGQHQTVVWSRSDASNDFIVEVRLSSDYGASWAPAVGLSATGENAANPQIAMSSDASTQSVSWTRRNDGVNYITQVVTTTDTGSTWSAGTDLSAAGQGASTPQIAVSSNGVVQTVAWMRSDGTNRIAQVSTSSDSGATWSSSSDLSEAGQSVESGDIRLAMSSSGAIQTVAWARSNGSNSIIQAVRLVNPTVASTSVAMAEFRFFTPSGEECSSISPARVVVGSMYTLPAADADCRTTPGSTVAGWTIPGPPGFTGYGSETMPFPPGLQVRVVESQRFTVVPFEPILEFTYDSNVADHDACTSNATDNSSEYGRVQSVWVPRELVSVATFPSIAACTPPGYELTGWNTQGNGSGEKFDVGTALPPEWETAADNRRTLYAVWVRGEANSP